MKKIVEDIKQYSNGSKIKALKTIFLNYNFHCVLLYRFSHFLYKIHLTFLSEVIKFMLRIIYSVDIDYRADMAGGFVLVHGIGVVIGAAVKTLGPVKIYQGVTLGGNNGKVKYIDGKRIAHPIIKSNVVLYSNCCVFGPVIIGENSIIGAMTIVTKDIDDNTKIFNKQEIVKLNVS